MAATDQFLTDDRTGQTLEEGEEFREIACREASQVGPRSSSAFQNSMGNPFIWAAITAITALIAVAVFRPTSCSSSKNCVALESDSSHLYNAFAATGLGTVLLHELASLFLSYRSLANAQGLLANLTKMLEPSALLCVSFSVLILENLILFISPSPWYAHSAEFGAASSGETAVVYTIFYVEWLINVPILLTLAGKCALGLSFEDIARPVVVTNVYIIAAWTCYFIPDTSARYAVVTLSFAMYAWASYDMVQWVVRFLRANPKSQSGLYLRPSLTLLLIVVFGIYGLVFVLRLLGQVDAGTERLFYTFMDIGSKLTVSIIFTGVRSSGYHALLLDMLVNTNPVFQRSISEA
ncbi:unnamed protein product [Polarella glacialis]|uniref:Uncharacterized protein n=1 Tax=Polarella glacialis TaxID=89957 RepID=A0A813EG16_POLGL|nr:unnamed protein product [Polarella glacialis]